VNGAEVEAAQNYLNGAAMVVTRRFLESVGPMREDYFLYAEEVEWCLRGAAKRMRLGFAPGARVKHAQGSTTGAGGHIRERSRLSVYLSTRNEMLLTRDLYPLRLPVAAIGALLVLSISFGRRGAWRQWAYAMSGWFAGLRNERGAPVWLDPVQND
jgi:GT2 family glycosyltransferase